MNHIQQLIQNCLVLKDYSQGVSICEQAIFTEPDVILHYWYLGLMQLLQKQEVEAQSTWLLGMSECDAGDDLSQVDKWTSDLLSILQAEAMRQESTEDLTMAWLIRRHSHEINSEDINNLLHMIRLSVQLQTMTESDLIDLQAIESLQEAAVGTVYPDLLSELVTQVLDYPPLYPSLIEFIEACVPHIYYPYDFVVKLIHAAVNLFYYAKQIELAIRLLEICLRLKHEEIEVLNHLSPMYQNIGQYQKSIDTAKLCCNLSEKITDRVFASQLLLRALIGSGGYWQEVVAAFEQHQTLTQTLIEDHPVDLASAMVRRFYLTGFFAPYLRDQPRLNHTIQNQLAQICQQNTGIYASEVIERYQKSHDARRHNIQSDRPLRIGYLSHCLNTHSVGWLARWLIKHHDRDRFKIFGYFAPYQQNQDPLQEWYVEQFDQAYRAGVDGSGSSDDIAEKIFQDEIDILIELDSVTLDGTCNTVSFKPAPVQVTWLGWDASGIPAIDYFIADPYVLPDSAQEYYSEKIWQLPETYIAVDGFEVAVPSLRRDHLDIPDDAVIYLSAQKGYKRHPDTIRLQMQIIKAVPNSFFLIKGSADQDKMRDFFIQIAQEEGVDVRCLRFLPVVENEAVHRANLSVADVVLDTYPYNGATTTLETLWMGVPLVTRVGEQFAARNSYTMMVNAGISEGIAWTDREYVEWGIRFGTEPELRKEVSWKLRESRKTSPLWNAEKFTRQMEDAYEQMWEKFQAPTIAELPEQPLIEPIPKTNLLVIPEAEYQNGLGIGFAQQGQIERAIACFELAIEIQSNFADAHYNLGIARSEQGNVDAAIASFTEAISYNPQYTSAYLNLGLTFTKQERYAEANDMYERALALAPNDVDILLAMGNLLFEQREIEKATNYYQIALNTSPNSAETNYALAVALTHAGKFHRAVTYYEAALKLDPGKALTHYNLGLAFEKLKKDFKAITEFQQAITLQSNFDDAYWNLINILVNTQNPTLRNHEYVMEIAQQCLVNCLTKSPVSALISFLSASLYCHCFLNNEGTMQRLEELEQYIGQNCDLLTKKETEQLYGRLNFILPNFRDNVAENNKLLNLVAQAYKNKAIIADENCLISNHADREIACPLRIGFISSHFLRHSMGWCSVDIVQELSKITPHIYLYTTSNNKTDDLTELFENIAEKFYRQTSLQKSGIVDIPDLVNQIKTDCIDILIDLDSTTIPIHAHILSSQPAPHCLVWLGWDAPQMHEDQYFLVDHHTHPKGVEVHYVEQLVRMPDSLVAIAGMNREPVDREAYRQSLGITPETIVYLCIAPARKITAEMVVAQIGILKDVPNSILIQRGNGDREGMKAKYTRECEAQGVDISRYKSLPPAAPEEKHRTIYAIADVLLDSYPFNGGTLSLETLWFDVPMVTRMGEQFFSRMGYSFLTTLGIDAGIANTWEEYVEWGIKFGTDEKLRNAVREKLIQSKKVETLAPLWNPQKFAQDLYLLLAQIALREEAK